MLFPFVDELTFYYVERLGNALVEVRRDYRAGLHDYVQHRRSMRVILVADSEGGLSGRFILQTREGKRVFRLQETGHNGGRKNTDHG